MALEKADEQNVKAHKDFYSKFEAINLGTVAASKDMEYLIQTVNEFKSSMNENLKKLSDQITEINMKPAKKWDNTVKTIVTAGISAIISFIVGRFTGGT